MEQQVKLEPLLAIQVANADILVLGIRKTEARKIADTERQCALDD